MRTCVWARVSHGTTLFNFTVTDKAKEMATCVLMQSAMFPRARNVSVQGSSSSKAEARRALSVRSEANGGEVAEGLGVAVSTNTRTSRSRNTVLLPQSQLQALAFGAGLKRPSATRGCAVSANGTSNPLVNVRPLTTACALRHLNALLRKGQPPEFRFPFTPFASSADGTYVMVGMQVTTEQLQKVVCRKLSQPLYFSSSQYLRLRYMNAAREAEDTE